MTSPDTQLVANLRLNVKALQAALDRSERDCRALAAAVLDLIPFDTTTAFGAVIEWKPSAQAVQRAERALEGWQAARTAQGVVVTAYDPAAKLAGRPYRKDTA